MYSKPIKTYYLNDDLGTNLPDRLSDALKENWQGKRFVSNDYSEEFDNSPSMNKDSSDYDYNDGNADNRYEVGKQDKLEKREGGIKRNFDEV